jgi:large subunit ribosomal protein L35Ae
MKSVALAGRLVGQKVAWKSGGNVRLGQFKSLHGRNGMVTVRFRRGVPGEAIGTVVEIVR